MKRSKEPGRKPKKRPLNPFKHPRGIDAKHGMKMDEQLFENLTPKGWMPRRLPKAHREDGT